MSPNYFSEGAIWETRGVSQMARVSRGAGGKQTEERRRGIPREQRISMSQEIRVGVTHLNRDSSMDRLLEARGGTERSAQIYAQRYRLCVSKLFTSIRKSVAS